MSDTKNRDYIVACLPQKSKQFFVINFTQERGGSDDFIGVFTIFPDMSDACAEAAPDFPQAVRVIPERDIPVFGS